GPAARTPAPRAQTGHRQRPGWLHRLAPQWLPRPPRGQPPAAQPASDPPAPACIQHGTVQVQPHARSRNPLPLPSPFSPPPQPPASSAAGPIFTTPPPFILELVQCLEDSRVGDLPLVGLRTRRHTGNLDVADVLPVFCQLGEHVPLGARDVIHVELQFEIR